jgi:cytochrome c-type biogenesis protein CcmH
MRLVVFSLFLCACSTEARGDEGAHAVEGRLLAPCCWTQTLDIHESEPASALRTEIHERLQHGERGAAIEDDLAARYGERIRAVNKGGDARNAIPAISAFGMLASALGCAAWFRKRKRVQVAATFTRDEYDARLDAELEQPSPTCEPCSACRSRGGRPRTIRS